MPAAHAQLLIPFSYWGCSKSKMSVADSTSANFSAGTFSNTMVSGNSVILSPAQVSGTFTSRVLDVYCGGIYSWSNFAWRSTLPFEKELTSTSEMPADYSAASGTLMNSVSVYYNFNETAINTAPSGNDFADRSGNARHATETSLGSYGVSGKFINAARLNGTSSYINVPATVASTAKSYTIATWLKTTTTAQGYSFDAQDGSNRIIIAPFCGSTCTVNAKIGVGFGATVGTIPSSTVASPNDGNWHHLVVTLDAASGNATIFLDGTSVFVYNTWGTGFNIGSSIKIGARYDGSNWYFNGDLDEYAIWNRAFSAAEVLTLYRRGANRVRFQVRSCTSSTCADVPAWRGPDGTTATFFSELYNNTVQLARTGNAIATYPILYFSNFTSLALPTNRYFQYQATLQTDNVTYTPDITYSRTYR